MTGSTPLLDKSLQEILSHRPSAVQGFLVLHTQCVGCPMARFCRLADVASYYGLDLQKLVDLVQSDSPLDTLGSKVTGNS